MTEQYAWRKNNLIRQVETLLPFAPDHKMIRSGIMRKVADFYLKSSDIKLREIIAELTHEKNRV